MGASLQHYQPLIDEAVRKEWGLPESWRESRLIELCLAFIRAPTDWGNGPLHGMFIELSAQAPFGVPAEGWAPAEKAFELIDDRVKFFQ